MSIITEKVYEEREALIMDAILFMHTYKKIRLSEEGNVVEWNDLRKHVREYLRRLDTKISECSMCGETLVETNLFLCIDCGRKLCEDHYYTFNDEGYYCIVCLRKRNGNG